MLLDSLGLHTFFKDKIFIQMEFNNWNPNSFNDMNLFAAPLHDQWLPRLCAFLAGSRTWDCRYFHPNIFAHLEQGLVALQHRQPFLSSSSMHREVPWRVTTPLAEKGKKIKLMEKILYCQPSGLLHSAGNLSKREGQNYSSCSELCFFVPSLLGHKQPPEEVACAWKKSRGWIWFWKGECAVTPTWPTQQDPS